MSSLLGYSNGERKPTAADALAVDRDAEIRELKHRLELRDAEIKRLKESISIQAGIIRRLEAKQ